jgi:hypothetical protein
MKYISCSRMCATHDFSVYIRRIVITGCEPIQMAIALTRRVTELT